MIQLVQVIYMEGRQKYIFKTLINKKGYMTSSKLAQITGVSVRTIKSDMIVVRDYCKQNGALLKSKTGCGYWIEVENHDIYNEIFYQSRIRNQFIDKKSTSHDTSSVYKRIISADDYINLDDIQNEFYMSRTQASNIVKNFKSILVKYNLRLDSNPNYGIKVIGGEFDKRILMLRLFSVHHHKLKTENEVFSFDRFFEQDTDEITKTRTILLKTLVKHDMQLSDLKTQQLSRYLVLQRKRKEANYELEQNDIFNFFDNFDKVQLISTEIFNLLNIEFSSTFNLKDISTLSFLLLSWIDLRDITSFYKFLSPFSKPIISTVDKFILYLDNFIPSSIYNDQDAKNNLIINLAPTIFNVICRHNLHYSESSIRDSKGDEAIAFTVTIIFKNFIYEEYKFILNDSFLDILISKISLHYHMYLLKNSFKLNALVCSGDSIGMSNLIKRDLINSSRINYFSEIRTIELYEGRYISELDYDIFILHDLDSLFYDYSWPLITVSSDTFKNDIKKIVPTIKDMNNNKIIREISKNITINNFFNLEEHDIQKYKKYYRFKNKYIILYKTNMEIGSFTIKHANTLFDDQFTIIEYNYDIKCYEDIYKLHLILSDLCS